MAQEGGKLWMIVGASRGLGKEFVNQLLARGDRVIATVRRPSVERVAETWKNQECKIYDCDMVSSPTIDVNTTLAEQLHRDGVARIDYLVLNAGVLKYPNRATELSYDDFAFHLHTNTIGPIICAQKLLKNVASIGTIAFISSDSGSAQCFREMEDGFAAYAASKAALNQMLRHMAGELKRQGSETIVIALHPGEVQTDMANVELGWEVEGQMTPQQSIAACIPVIESKKRGSSGTFWTYEDLQYPW